MNRSHEAHPRSPSAEVIADIYQAGAGTKSWSGALTRIARELDLNGCQIVGISTTRGALLFSHVSAGLRAEAQLEYLRTYHGVDPRIPLLAKQKEGEWLYDEDVFAKDIAATNPFYRDLLVPYGGRFTAAVKVFEQDGETLLVGLLSHGRDSGFSEDRRQYLESMSFHLCQAGAIHQKRRRVSEDSFAGPDLLHRMKRPAFLLGPDRTAVLLNPAARVYMANHYQLTFARDRLIACDKHADADLGDAFRAIEHDLAKGGAPRRHVVRLPASAADPSSVLSLTAFVPSESMYVFGTAPQVLLMVHDRTSKTVPDLLMWEAAFDLTPSQSRVALELFKGCDTREVSIALNVALSTVKTHLKDIYAKTGTSRQAQLVLALGNLQSW